MVTYDGLPMDWVLVCIVGGTSGSADITLPSPRVEGARILDGTVTWALRKIATYGGIGYRQSSTACPTGSIAFSTALPAGWYLEATTGGITDSGDITLPSPVVENATVMDGTVVWTIRSISADLAGKADRSLSNLTDAGKSFSFPSDTYETITMSGNPTQYTVPADGYVYIYGQRNSSSGAHTVVTLLNTTTGVEEKDGRTNLSSGVVTIFSPVKKGDSITISHQNTTSIQCKFYYAQGEVPV